MPRASGALSSGTIHYYFSLTPNPSPRKEFEGFRFAEGVEKIEDLRPGMKLDGIITNVTAFGAFVDIGVHQDGLVHVSQLSDHFVKDPNRVVKVQQKVKVTVLSVDLERKRISLSLREKEEGGGDRPRRSEPKRAGGGQKQRETVPFNNPFRELLKKK